MPLTPRRRELALHLCSWATYEGKGAPVDSDRYRVVTEGRTLPHGAYSSCGDLVHWMLYSLGCRDRSLCNRESLGGWRVGQNLSLLDRHRELRRPWAEPAQPGDIVLIEGEFEHVCVVQEWGPQWATTYDYGQPGGEMRVRELKEPRSLYECWGIGNGSASWIMDLDKIEFTAEPSLPPDLLGQGQD